jgi:[acyl-carrier-protein] S-malonyltransferase
MSVAFTFPGQGSQAVGMGAGLSDASPAARAVFDEVDAALGEKLSDVIRNGPAERLTLTENAQPALMAVSIAALRALEDRGVSVERHVAFVAGHSLGEYSALAAAGALGVGDAARLLRLRGRAMQEAVPVGEGAMAALLGCDLEQAQALAEAAAQGEVCQVANDNAPGQVVISGAKGAIDRAIARAAEFGVRRAAPLPVSAPFHSALMGPAQEKMRAALAEAEITTPVAPVVVNVLAAPLSDPEDIRASLVEQVTGMVRWRESVAWLAAQGVTDFYEIGAGRVLSGIARRIAPEAKTHSVGTPEEADAAAAALTAG